MYLACIVGSFVILFAAAETPAYKASSETVQTITFYDNKEDRCNPSKMVIKCCICLEMINKYLPIVTALIDQKINTVCSANRFFRGPCRKLANKLKNKVIGGFFPGSPLQSCNKYKMC